MQIKINGSCSDSRSLPKYFNGEQIVNIELQLDSGDEIEVKTLIDNLRESRNYNLSYVIKHERNK